MTASAPLYLDHNAGSPLRREALDAMRPWLERGAANASSLHRAGQAARAALEDAREQVARGLGGWSEEWIFTSGATEACNLALQGACAEGRPLLVGATEHPAVLETAQALQAAGARVELLEVLPDGRVDREGLKEALEEFPGALVALMLANNETGVCHPVRELSGLVRAAKGLFFCDLAQAAGKIPVDVRDLGLDLAAASASKFAGPQGLGMLYVRKGLALKPLLHGGHQEKGLRPGTENVAGAVGAAAALDAALRGLPAQARDWEGAVASLERGLTALFPGIVIHGHKAPRVPNTLCVSLPGQDRDLLLLRLDQLGLQVSAGAACAAGASQPSTVLAAMGASDSQLKTEVRFSLGPGQNEATAREACARVGQALEGFRRLGL
ncbi:MAG TPA: aminotransferase class V-fold PLP-dependent enzyme [bacterium]|nr:aminotransferase class V-fold PLP-dependent enzyme [bacterium]